MSRGLRDCPALGPFCRCGALGLGPAFLAWLSSGAYPGGVLAALTQERAWTPVIRKQRKEIRASGSTGAQQEGGTGGTAGAMPRGRSFPQTCSSHSPTPRGRQTLNRTQTLPGPEPRGRRPRSYPPHFLPPPAQKGAVSTCAGAAFPSRPEVPRLGWSGLRGLWRVWTRACDSVCAVPAGDAAG